MSAHYKAKSRQLSNQLSQKLADFLRPFLLELDQLLDRRLVETLHRLVETILIFRHQSYGLLLSELGGYLLSPAQAPAGTKRISNLLRSAKWHYQVIERFLWRQGSQAIEQLVEGSQTALCLWDESVLEKAESEKLEGLCAVRSTKGARLKRIKPGFYNPPGRPIFVPGMNWLMVMITGMTAAPTLAAMTWWTTRGVLKTSKRTVEKQLLKRCARQWGRRVIHVWDRGFAGSPWLAEVMTYKLRFVLRWNKNYKLDDGQGQTKKAWQLTRGKRSLDHQLIWDARRRCQRQTGLYFRPVFLPESTTPLFLVVSRPGQGRSPWYILTNEPVLTPEDAWRIVFIYARRWQIEMGFRLAKSELAFQSPRLWQWENRLKLLLIASLALAFLFSLLSSLAEPQQQLLFRFWCHRTGKRYRDASLPLYRLRSALSRLWLFYPPPGSALRANSG